MKMLLGQKLFLPRFCFLDHKRCCLAFNLLGLCLAVEKSVNGHAQIANTARYRANDFSVEGCKCSWHHVINGYNHNSIIIHIL